MAETDGEQPDNTQKTEDPTPKKLEEARRRGQVAMSREVNNWVMLMAGTLIIGTLAGTMFTDMQVLLTVLIEKSWDFPAGPGGIGLMLGGLSIRMASIMALPVIILLMAAFFAPFAQIGPIFAPEIIKPDIGKISPMKGFQRLFSMRSLVEFVKGILKLLIVGAVGTIVIYPYFGQIDHMIGLPMPLLLNELYTLILRLLIGMLIALAVIAAIDLVYQRQSHYQKMRMTRQETKDEYKQTEGDPHVKARLRQLRSEKARRRMMQNVPKADVVITNPTHFSIALQYDPDTMEAPVCIAKGIDSVALRIREVAREHNIILYENPPLARTLYDVVDLDEAIPPEQYKAVAEVISFVFRTRGRKKPV